VRALRLTALGYPSTIAATCCRPRSM
jgi:hypothetical protein